jgi:hypothetical protein
VVTVDALAPARGRPLNFSGSDHANAQPTGTAPGACSGALLPGPGPVGATRGSPRAALGRDVLVLGLGAFGRTPRVTENDVLMRRGHWPQATGALVSGGSRGMGQVVGATSSRGDQPRSSRAAGRPRSRASAARTPPSTKYPAKGEVKAVWGCAPARVGAVRIPRRHTTALRRLACDVDGVWGRQRNPARQPAEEGLGELTRSGKGVGA